MPMGRVMEPPPGAVQRAVLVAVPLVLVVVIVVTPSLVGQEQPATSIPFLLIEVLGEGANETGLFYVRSALSVTVYGYLAINVTGLGMYAGANWSLSATDVPSLWLKVPLQDARLVNVTAVAADERGAFRYGATVEFVSDPDDPVVKVQAEGTAFAREYRGTFTVPMSREVMP